MKRPTLAETAIGLALAVAVGAPLGVLLAQPTPVHAVTQACADGAAPSVGGYPGDPVQVCQVGAIPNPPKPTEPAPAPCISITAGDCIAPDLTRP